MPSFPTWVWGFCIRWTWARAQPYRGGRRVPYFWHFSVVWFSHFSLLPMRSRWCYQCRWEVWARFPDSTWVRERVRGTRRYCSSHQRTVILRGFLSPHRVSWLPGIHTIQWRYSMLHLLRYFPGSVYHIFVSRREMEHLASQWCRYTQMRAVWVLPCTPHGWRMICTELTHIPRPIAGTLPNLRISLECGLARRHSIFVLA